MNSQSSQYSGRDSSFEIAQLNIAELMYPLDSPELFDFVANIDRINKLADESKGFVWRLQTEEGDATGIDYFGPDKIVNMSVWESIEDLHNYVYRTAHVEIMRRKKEWFSKLATSHLVLWWVPRGHKPTVEEAHAKLELIQVRGPTQEAFTFKDAYPPPTDS